MIIIITFILIFSQFIRMLFLYSGMTEPVFQRADIITIEERGKGQGNYDDPGLYEIFRQGEQEFYQGILTVYDFQKQRDKRDYF